MAKKKIVNELIPSSVSLEDISFIGMKHECESYRLAYYLNKKFELKLSREDGFLYYKEDEATSYSFPMYIYFDEGYRLYYFLIKTVNNNILIDDVVSYYDTILLIFGSEHSTFAKKIVDNCYDIQDVFLCESVDFRDIDTVKKTASKKYKKNLKSFLENALLLDIQEFLNTLTQKQDKRDNDVFFQF